MKLVTSVTDSVRTNFKYDSNNNYLTSVEQRYNAQATVTIATYSYNSMGQLTTKKLGKTSGGSYLQTLDYRFNIRGQLVTLNDSKLSTTDNDLFGMIIRYDVSDTNVGNTPQYSGRISAVRWMSRDGSNNKTNERAYKYSYDALNRLTGAAYVERSITGTGVFNLNTNGFNENGITYDENGNILTLKRRTSTVGGTTSKEVDNLNYTYDTDNPNQLSTVTDGVAVDYTGFGFRNITGSTVPYRYDANGNLIADHYKADTIAYNILNKTDRITITNATGRYISYTYNADGSVLRKQVYENSVIQSTTNYINGFVYNDGNLSYFSMPEGRVVKSGGTMQPEYVIADHQGNARFSFKDNGSGGIQILQENSFYAFGKTMPNSTVSLPSLPNINLYNGGSEWQNTFNDLPDYYQTYFRNYDPAIGRFIGVDPKAEATDELTTYNYCGGNPIMFNDPLGDQKYMNEFSWMNGMSTQERMDYNMKVFISSFWGELNMEKAAIDAFSADYSAWVGGMNSTPAYATNNPAEIAYIFGNTGGRNNSGEGKTYQVQLDGRVNILPNGSASDDYRREIDNFDGFAHRSYYGDIDMSAAKSALIGMINPNAEALKETVNWFKNHFDISGGYELSYGAQIGGGFKKAMAGFVNLGSTVHSDLVLSNKKEPSSHMYKPDEKITRGIGAAYYGGIDYKRESYGGQTSNTLSLGVFGFGGNVSWNQNGITDWFAGFDPSVKGAFVFGLEINFRIGFSK